MKCRYCKAYVSKQDAYIFVFNKSNTYFCNEEHYNLFVEDKENIKNEKIKENAKKTEIYLLICEIFGRKEIINTTLWKEWKEWNKVASNEIIKQYLEENKKILHDSISKITSSEFAKIRYLSTVLKNNLNDYQKNRIGALAYEQSEENTQNIKRIDGLQAKYHDLDTFTNAYIDMYLNPSHKWNYSIELDDRISFIFAANILNEDKIAQYILEMSYNDFLCTPYWKAIADYVKHKFNYTCKLCENKDDLNVHHKTYDHHGYEHRSAVIETDLTVLCKNCHKKIHSIQ